MTANHTPDFDDESEQQEWLAEQFRDAGWVAKREVSPIGSNRRADLITQGEEYPPVGIETKHLNTSDSAGVLAKALIQTAIYRGESYENFGKVDYWAICPYFEAAYTYGNSLNTSEKFIREFFNYFGVGFIDLSRWGIFVDFSYSDRDAKIFIKDISPYDHDIERNKEKYGSARRIAKTVGGKIQRLEEI